MKALLPLVLLLASCSQNCTPKPESISVAAPVTVADKDAENRVFRNNWDKYVTAKVTPDLAFLGGVKGGLVTVYNALPYSIDNGVVSVSYWQGNGDFYKNENIQIPVIRANDSVIISIPKSDRGTRCTVDIESLQSTALNFCGDFPAANSPLHSKPAVNVGDPYKCK